jgi:hypothetical protein
VVAQAVMIMVSSVWLTCSTEQPRRSGNNAMRDMDSFLEKPEEFLKEAFSLFYHIFLHGR